MVGMVNPAGTDDFPRDLVDDFPPDVKAAFHRYRRAGAALRLYRRRGWNPSAVLASVRREREQLERLLERLEHDEQNPRLF